MISLMLKTVFNDKMSKKNTIRKCTKNQIEFQSKLSSVRVGGNKSDKQLSEIENITKFYKSREKVIQSYNDYPKIVHKPGYNLKHGKELKISTAKQVLERLPIAFA